MTVVLDDDIGMLGLDGLGQCAQQSRLANTCHILQTDFLSTGGNHLVGNFRIIFDGMHRTGSDTQRSLWNHTSGLGPLDRGDNITCVVQTTENTGDVHTLSFLHLVHQFANVVGNRVHTQGVKATIQHVCLDTHLIERLTESTYSQIGVLASHEVHLLKGATIGFHTGKAPHVNDNGSNAL